MRSISWTHGEPTRFLRTPGKHETLAALHARDAESSRWSKSVRLTKLGRQDMGWAEYVYPSVDMSYHISQRTWLTQPTLTPRGQSPQWEDHSQSLGSAVCLFLSFIGLQLVCRAFFYIFFLYNGTSVQPHSCPNVYLGPDNLLSNFTGSQMQNHFRSNSYMI